MSMDPLTAGLDFGKAVVGVVDQFVDDGDLSAKLKNEILTKQMDFSTTLVQTKTTPKTDALVKLLFALRDVAIPLFRPVGSALLAGFGAYLAVNQIPTPEWLDAMMVAAFPGWMVSRHSTKQAEIAAQSEKDRMEALAKTVKPSAYENFEQLQSNGG